MKKIQVTSNLTKNIEESKKNFNTMDHFIINYMIGVLFAVGYFLFMPVTFEIINIILIEVLGAASAFTYIQKQDFIKRKEAAKKALIDFAINLRKEDVYLNEDTFLDPIILIRSELSKKEKNIVIIETTNYIYLSGRFDKTHILEEKTIREGRKITNYSVELCEQEDIEEMPNIQKKLSRKIRKYRI